VVWKFGQFEVAPTLKMYVCIYFSKIAARDLKKSFLLDVGMYCNGIFFCGKNNLKFGESFDCEMVLSI
jgi:hypothetical protein